MPLSSLRDTVYHQDQQGEGDNEALIPAGKPIRYVLQQHDVIPFSLHLLAVVGIVMSRASAIVRWAAALNYSAFVFFWIALPIARTPVSSILALLASLGLILLATMLLFRLLLKNASRARRI